MNARRARGIGRAICETFAAHGETVIILDREADEAAQVASALGTQHRAIAADLSKEDEITAAFAQIARDFGRVDILVNNAAIADRFMPVGEQSADYLTSVLDINLTGAFIALQQALALMPKPGGVILNLGSINTSCPFATPPCLWRIEGRH